MPILGKRYVFGVHYTQFVNPVFSLRIIFWQPLLLTPQNLSFLSYLLKLFLTRMSSHTSQVLTYSLQPPNLLTYHMVSNFKLLSLSKVEEIPRRDHRGSFLTLQQQNIRSARNFNYGLEKCIKNSYNPTVPSPVRVLHIYLRYSGTYKKKLTLLK